MSGAIDKISAKLDDKPATQVPEIDSFRQFLMEHASVRTPSGKYIPYSLEGREALGEVVDVIDHVLGSHTGKQLPDAKLAICGGAQIGKTILECNLMGYATGVLFKSCGLYLPDEKLVEGVVDTKLRPDVIERVDFLGPLMTLGKAKDSRGRMVNRKGAFMVKDGDRVAEGMVVGMNKIPTTFSMSIAIEDEKDDIPQKNSQYLEGRMGASDLRFRISIGTQRLHGLGQNKEWQDGSQGIFEFEAGKGERIRPETLWPQVCRLAVEGEPKPSDPKLTLTGDFEDADGKRWPYRPGQAFYLADPDSGAVIDRTKPRVRHLRPEQVEMLNWSFSISQLSMAAYDMGQIASRWQKAVRDPVAMVAFRCEVLGIPTNTTQGLSPEILQRSRVSGAPFDMVLDRGAFPSFAGLDTGNSCWWFSRSIESEAVKRCQWAEEITLADVVRRAEVLFRKLGISALFIDARPAVAEARELTYRLHGLADFKWPKVQDPEKSVIRFPNGLVWDGKRGVWQGLRCAVVEFARKEGGGMVHKIGQDPKNGVIRFFPIIQVNRFESIDRVIQEFLTPGEDIVRLDARDELIEEPVMRLPRQGDGSPPILKTLDAHLITGSARVEEGEEKGDYVDKVANHLLLADAYSGLAEMVASVSTPSAPVKFATTKMKRGRRYAG